MALERKAIGLTCLQGPANSGFGTGGCAIHNPPRTTPQERPGGKRGRPARKNYFPEHRRHRKKLLKSRPWKMINHPHLLLSCTKHSQNSPMIKKKIALARSCRQHSSTKCRKDQNLRAFLSTLFPPLCFLLHLYSQKHTNTGVS